MLNIAAETDGLVAEERYRLYNRKISCIASIHPPKRVEVPVRTHVRFRVLAEVSQGTPNVCKAPCGPYLRRILVSALPKVSLLGTSAGEPIVRPARRA